MSDLKVRILKAVQPDLDAIETALAKNLNPHLDLVRDVAGHILFSGGKRLRPLLMVLSARLCGYRGDYDKTFSTALEYLHAATLLHDDLVDGASLRRNKPAAHLKWGNSIAVLVGDFLLARALSVSAATGRARIVQILAELTEQMSQGEVHQLMRKGDIRLSEAEYLEVIRRKTAVLFETACRVSAVLADASAEKESALAAYGLNLGMAFQIADDLFDYTLGHLPAWEGRRIRPARRQDDAAVDSRPEAGGCRGPGMDGESCSGPKLFNRGFLETGRTAPGERRNPLCGAGR